MTFNYPEIIENAHKDLMKKILKMVEKNGLSGEHHFYVTFKTKHPRVKVPSFLKAEHPEQITIVLQYEFDTLRVNDEEFGVRLRFDQKYHYLRIPFESVSYFADPSSDFALHFPKAEKQIFSEEIKNEIPELPYDDDEKIISLDLFRKT
ncbi:MAG: hypothetical protein JXR30_01975 [Alphaproteobacteria bacterium]|nr:hypothetical protein [Alphaproteobacteria bacterium]